MTTRANLYIDQGIDFTTPIELSGDDGSDFVITDQTFFCQARKIYSTSIIVSANVDVSIGDPPNDINLIIPGSATEITVPGKYQYDIIMLESNGSKKKLLEGLMFILPTITQTP